jgi:CheY-like chemotaxis protein
MMAVRAHEKGLELLCATDLNVPTLLIGDPARLRQVLTNLTGNAVKFCHTGEVSIRVSLEDDGAECRKQEPDTVEKETVLLRFSVRDTGIGISADKMMMLTSIGMRGDAKRFHEIGFSAYSTKPIRHLELKAVPIIAMTAHTMKGDRERCLEAGMNDYISKFISPQALAEMLEK